MNKTLVIIGSITVLGTEVFLYLKNKKKSDIRVVGIGNKNVGSGAIIKASSSSISSSGRALVSGGRRNNNA